MIVLGLDPGFDKIGYAFTRGIEVIDFGIIKTDPDLAFIERLDLIDRTLSHLITMFKPDEAAIEIPVFTISSANAALVQQAIGVIKLTVFHHNIGCREYHPQTIKATLASGRATKRTIKKAVAIVFGDMPKGIDDDAFDALAVAATHIKNRNTIRKVKVK